MVGLSVAVAVLWWWSGYLSSTIRDRMRKTWNNVITGTLAKLEEGDEPKQAKEARKSRRNLWRGHIQPWLYFVFFLVVIGVLVNKALVSVQDSIGLMCKEQKNTPFVTRSTETDFAAAESCVNLNMQVREGHTYQVSIKIPDTWRDRGITANLKGLDDKSLAEQSIWIRLFMGAGVAIRRHWSLPWYQPVIRIGASGREIIELNIAPPLAPGQDNRKWLYGRFTAKSNGELFIYVNDAVFITPNWPVSFYSNNSGVAKITVEDISPPKGYRQQPAGEKE